jgi:sporulation protein YlmC with PRC-barrel domain
VSSLLLVHDVLDAQLLDRQKEKIGRVDDLALELREGRPPRVATILIGGAVRAERVGRWMIWLRRAARVFVRRQEERVSRIPFEAVRVIADTIELDVDGNTLESGHLEGWLADHIVSRIPGGQGERKGERT